MICYNKKGGVYSRMVVWSRINALLKWIKFSQINVMPSVLCQIRILQDPCHLFTQRTDVLPRDLLTYRSGDIRVKTFQIALKFDRHLGSRATEIPSKFQSNTVFIRSNPRLRDFSRSCSKKSVRLVNKSPVLWRVVYVMQNNGYVVKPVMSGHHCGFMTMFI